MFKITILECANNNIARLFLKLSISSNDSEQFFVRLTAVIDLQFEEGFCFKDAYVLPPQDVVIEANTIFSEEEIQALMKKEFNMAPSSEDSLIYQSLRNQIREFIDNLWEKIVVKVEIKGMVQ